MVPALFAQFARPLSWGLGELVIALIIFGAIVAIAYVILRHAMGVTIPQWLINVFWIVVAAAVGIIAIRFLLSL